MIVKRMIESLKRQDWMMVAVEFILVVVGVLLGFQINTWANARASRSTTEIATTRLLEEAERSIAYIRNAVAYEDKVASNVAFAAARLHLKGWSNRERARIIQGLADARHMVALAPPSSVYDDIVSSGDLNSIGNVEVRAAISRYRSTLSFEERMRQQLQSGLPAFERIGAFAYHADEHGKSPLVLEVDFALLRKDRVGQQAIALTAEDHRILLMLRNRALTDATKMCIVLGRSVGRTCNLHATPPVFD